MRAQCDRHGGCGSWPSACEWSRWCSSCRSHPASLRARASSGHSGSANRKPRPRRRAGPGSQCPGRRRRTCSSGWSVSAGPSSGGAARQQTCSALGESSPGISRTLWPSSPAAAGSACPQRTAAKRRAWAGRSLRCPAPTACSRKAPGSYRGPAASANPAPTSRRGSHAAPLARRRPPSCRRSSPIASAPCCDTSPPVWHHSVTGLSCPCSHLRQTQSSKRQSIPGRQWPPRIPRRRSSSRCPPCRPLPARWPGPQATVSGKSWGPAMPQSPAVAARTGRRGCGARRRTGGVPLAPG
mmetsp:Transcript_24398/g.70391  ORF Transcript_24398/g.70391 Transcript_24398/m.70391 type:complete len:297 (-) Transcript_24398:157-1047(-)